MVPPGVLCTEPSEVHVQQHQMPRQSYIQVRSDITHQVSLVDSTKLGIHPPLQKEMRG